MSSLQRPLAYTRTTNNRIKRTMMGISAEVFSKNGLISFCCLLGLFACTGEQSPSSEPIDPATVQLFQLLPADQTHLQFENTIVENNRINILNYLYYYNGSGVAVGDINQDGLPDIYFGATTNPNKLFLNKGNFVFEDITQSAGVAGEYGITTGVSFVDINQDGFLDIYVCKSGVQSERYRTNQLFVNNGNLTFTEKAEEYGLADASFSNQAYFFDMDLDHDLDMYLVNHPVDWPNINKIMTGEQNEEGFHDHFSDKLYRNNGQGKFEDITRSAGVLNRSWGLSAAIGDFNDDLLPDIYVANDFIKPDNLYINQGDGTFKDQIQQYFRHISFYSMGTDYADINNDGRNDLFVADMAMNGHVRSKRNMGSMSTENFQTIIRRGYHYPYSSNTLQLHVGKNSFADIAQAAGVAKTDWSWAPLLMDFDNDGHKDIFVTNGIYRDIIDNDFLLQKASYDQREEKTYFDDLLPNIPQTRVKNFLFHNQGDLTFSKLSEQWGIEQASNSNGAAYADLDNDGDLDLITNNLNEPASLYENRCSQKIGNHFLKIQLTGPDKNRNAIGAQVLIEVGDKRQRVDMQPARGYLSSVDYVLHVGLGKASKVDKIRVIWPDGKTSQLSNPEVNRLIHIPYPEKGTDVSVPTANSPLFSDQTTVYGLKHLHQERIYDDFAQELLLPHKLSQNGPFLSVADVNGDNLDDFFIGGSAGYPGALFLQQDSQRFLKSSEVAFARDKAYEDQQSVFFDADQDGDLDLYVVSGSNEFVKATMLQDRLYHNDGKGNFSDASSALPRISSSGMAVVAHDVDEDGDMDLVVGGRVIAGKYPTAPKSYLLENQQGTFVDATQKFAPDLERLGMITDLSFSDYDGDGDADLVVVGEWMPISFFENEKGKFHSRFSVPHSNGWWFSLAEGDIDQDGDQDYVLGNIGHNNKYQPTAKKPLHLYYNDFDGNGTGDIVLSKMDQQTLFPVRGRECSSQQMPFIKDKFPDFASFANAPMEEIYDKDKLANALHYEAQEFKSTVLINQGNEEFDIQYLPTMAQLSPLMGIELTDINGDGHPDILAAGNFFVAETETIRYDAGSGVILLGDGRGNFAALSTYQSGLLLKEDVRDLSWIRLANGKKGLLVASNQDMLRLLVQN